ncbi:MAG TPA: UDP-3-O-(3-hydroxymyristoyl)glucosamine N-acyltransferase [Blastocatellia bacterium]|nr:UDP-3-O-(3-hydroxymyristoyl)glucosamine N-acyltransferase [Blastocatellia bacterium]
MRLDEIATLLSCTVEGDGSTEVLGIATLEEAGEQDLSFLANPRYQSQSRTTRAAALIVGPDVAFTGRPLLRNENPYLVFAKALDVFFPAEHRSAGIHPSAVVASSAVLGIDIEIGPYAVLGERVRIGDFVSVGSGCLVEKDVTIGDESRLHSGCVIKERVTIGHRCIIQSNAVVGSDGFGYARKADGSWYRITQRGTVILEDDVEVGACSTIDRPTLGVTRVGRGTKIDNLVQVGHSCTIGEDCLLCAQVGLAGSTTLGNQVILAGQVGAAGHLTIGDRAMVGAQGGVANSIPAGNVVAGTPAIDQKTWVRYSGVLPRLPEIRKSIRDLDRRIAAIEDALKVLS